jgi:hypothetical protein
MTAEGSIPATDAGDSRGLSLDRKTLLPGLAILALIVVPVLLWAASSGGSGNKLRIDQGVNVYGSPEIVVNVPKKMNFASEATTPNRVQLICVDSGGGTVLHTPQPWPFIIEPGYPLPHIHQPVTPAQMQKIATCRLEGTKSKFEGPLRRNTRP